MREIRTSGSMSGDGKRSHAADCDTGKGRKPPAPVKPCGYSHCARPRLYCGASARLQAQIWASRARAAPSYALTTSRLRREIEPCSLEVFPLLLGCRRSPR